VNKKNLASFVVLAIVYLLVCAPRVYDRARTAEGIGVPSDPTIPRASNASMGSIGLFENHADIGSVLHPGAVEFDATNKSYTVTGSGENMWFKEDAFHFVWKKVSGDRVRLAASIGFIGSGGNPHRKAVLMIRQSLDADSAYVDVALHGNGLTSLQYRDDKGGATQEIESNVSAPKRVCLETKGQFAYLLLSAAGEALHLAGGSFRVPFASPFYVGIGLCSHDKDVLEKAIFSDVELDAPPAAAAGTPTLYSTLETVSTDSMDRRVTYVTKGRIEAPNWTPDGRELIFNRDGRLYRVPVSGGEPQIIDTGFATRCNNDHGIAPDGSWLAISDSSQENGASLIYVLPLAGGTPQRVTQHSPSYWHGRSPDGKTLCFCGERNGAFDVYTIPVAGGEETQMTRGAGHNDGPEYSPDGNYIYFNSDRSGSMQIWRMRCDGSEQVQVTADEFNNWFPHISPDGKQMVFLTYEKGVAGHPPDKNVLLRLMSMSGGKVSVLAKLLGGQGTINVPSWAPDSRQLAFVSYQYF